MDFVSRHPALKRDTAEAQRFSEIYQQLGLAWEFLALQCPHPGGWRKLRDGKSACKVCGLIRGVKEQWLLLPRDSKKTIGRRAMPNSKRTFPNRRAATVVNDTVDFYGTKLNVEVLNQHGHSHRFFRKHDWTIAADRMVWLEEGGIQVRFDTHLSHGGIAQAPARRNAALQSFRLGTPAQVPEKIPRDTGLTNAAGSPGW